MVFSKSASVAFTIVRDPLEQFQSQWDYYAMGRHYGMGMEQSFSRQALKDDNFKRFLPPPSDSDKQKLRNLSWLKIPHRGDTESLDVC